MNMNVSNKDMKFVNMAVNAANKSSMLMRHGCVITCNNKFICDGYNSTRTQFQDNFINTSCSCHAEMDALRKLLRIKSKGRNNNSYSHRKTLYNQQRKYINNEEYFFRKYNKVKIG
jgi:deoxycytidylate deaminase